VRKENTKYQAKNKQEKKYHTRGLQIAEQHKHQQQKKNNADTIKTQLKQPRRKKKRSTTNEKY